MELVENIITQLQEIHDTAVATLRADVIAFATTGTVPPVRKREDGSYAYPQLSIHFEGKGEPSDRSRAFGRLEKPGTYSTTITRPALFSGSLKDQLEMIARDYEVRFEVTSSRPEIPFPYEIGRASLRER